MKRTTVLFILFFTSLLPLTAQRSLLGQLGANGLEVSKQGERVAISLTLSLDSLQLSSNDLLIITPVVRHQHSEAMQILPQVQIVGRTREVILQRYNAHTVPDNLGHTIAHHVVRKNRSKQQIRYQASVIFEEWMYEGELLLQAHLYGCAECFAEESEWSLLTPVLRPPYVPQPRLTYLEPTAEPVKARAEKHTATLSFRSAKHDLDPNYLGNREELQRVDQVMREIVSSNDLQVTSLEVVGYASPEGNYGYNKALSERRADAFAGYLSGKFGIPKSQMSVKGHGEDWQMLREIISNSSLEESEKILEIIDNVSEPDARDVPLRKIAGGSTYQLLLSDIYPRIRRTEYEIAYEVRPFSVEEAREIIKQNPKLLSLNEMYLVALSYPPKSREFKEVFDIAVRLYPEEPIAIINASAADIEGGSYRAAIERLGRLADNPIALNNAGVAYLLLGDLEKAEFFLQKASDKGSNDATHNLGEIQKMREH